MAPTLFPTLRVPGHSGDSPSLLPSLERAVETLRNADANSSFPCYAIEAETKTYCKSTCSIPVREINAALDIVHHVDPPYSARQAISVSRLFLCSRHHQETECSSPLIVGLVEAFGQAEGSAAEPDTPKLYVPGQWPEEDTDDEGPTTRSWVDKYLSKRHESCASELSPRSPSSFPNPEAQQDQQHNLHARVDFSDAKWEVFLLAKVCCIGSVTGNARCHRAISASARIAAQDTLDQYMNKKAPMRILRPLLRHLLCSNHSHPEWLEAYQDAWAEDFVPDDHRPHSTTPAPVTKLLQPAQTRIRSSSVSPDSKGLSDSPFPAIERKQSPTPFLFAYAHPQSSFSSSPSLASRDQSPGGRAPMKTSGGALKAKNRDKHGSNGFPRDSDRGIMAATEADETEARSANKAQRPNRTSTVSESRQSATSSTASVRRAPLTDSLFSCKPHQKRSALPADEKKVWSSSRHSHPQVRVTPLKRFSSSPAVNPQRPVTPEQQQQRKESSRAAASGTTTPSAPSLASPITLTPSPSASPLSLEERFRRLRARSEPPPDTDVVTSHRTSLSASSSPSSAPSTGRLSSSTVTRPTARHEPIFTSTKPPPTRLPLGELRALETSLIKHFEPKPPKQHVKQPPASPQRRLPRFAHVYVLTTPELPGLVKVGMAHDVMSRTAQLLSSCNFPACALEHASARLPRAGARMAESLAHKVLRTWRRNVLLPCPFGTRSLHREWFACDARVAERVVEMWSRVAKAVATVAGIKYEKEEGGKEKEWYTEHGALKLGRWAERLHRAAETAGPTAGESLEEMLERHERWLLAAVEDC